jgi:two-component system NtrC family sensor kinase
VQTTGAGKAVQMDRWVGVPRVDEPRRRAWPTGIPKARPAPDEEPEQGGPAAPASIDRLAPDEEPEQGGPAAPASIDRLALMARYIGDGVVVYGPGGRIDWVNDGFVRMTGYSAAEAVGALRTDLVHGPFRRSPEFTRLADDLAALRQVELEFVTRTKQGTPYWVAMSAWETVEDGRVVGLVGVERDITLRRHAEERARLTLRRAESLGVALRHEKHLLSTVLATIPHLVWWKNSDLRFVGANHAYLAFQQLGSVAELVGRREDQLDRRSALGPALGELEAVVLASGEPVNGRTLTVTSGDRQLTFLVSLLPYREDTRIAGVIGIGADISQVTELERQLAQANRLESIGQLAAGIAHEINTPVQYVSDNTRFVADTFGDVLAGLAELAELADGQETDATRVRAVLDRLDLSFVAEEVPSALTQSMEGLEHVGGIVRAMKDFSHPGHGRGEVDLNRVIETTMHVTRNEWKYQAVLDLDLDPGLGVVNCFEGEIKQVLLNLVVNAAQAIAERRRRTGDDAIGRITIRTGRDGDEVHVAVQDDGIGMDESVRERVFDPFFTTKPVGQGTGQGLSLAHDIVVRRHGGRIEVASTSGCGSIFTVCLPAVVPAHLFTGGQDGDPDGRTEQPDAATAG